MKRIYFNSLMLACVAAAAVPMTVCAQASQDLGLTRVSPDEIAHMPGLTADYVRTPNGYFHASCVQHVDQSEELQPDGSIRRADGRLRQVAACAYPHFLRSGVRIEATDKALHLPEVYNGYLQLVSTTLPAGSHNMTADMTVPAAPTDKWGQTLYFFPGLEDAQGVVTILQPVLGWDGYGGNNWTIASWNCCKSGTTYVGNNVVVRAGDLIEGTMVNTINQKWTVTATDETQTALASAVLNTSGYNQIFDWIFAGALETYGVSSCGQFPSKGPIAFTDIQVHSAGKLVAKPAWSISPGTNKETACTSATVVDSGDVDIGY